MRTKGRRSASSQTHRVARTYANRLGKKVIQLDDKDRLRVPAIKGHSDSLFWHVVTTAPRQERRAHEGITDLGGVAYCPAQIRWRHYARDKRAEERALFTGYLFLGLRPGQGINWDGEARRRIGVTHVSYLPPIVSRALAGFLEEVERRQMAGDFDEPGTTKHSLTVTAPLFEVGEQVQIIQGAFANFMATVISAGPKTAKVETHLFGRATEVNLPVEHLRAKG